MDERAKQILGRRVEETRRDLGISKVDFCVATGISRPYLDRIEDGTANFTLKVLFKIAPALGMTVSVLLEGIELPFLLDLPLVERVPPPPTAACKNASIQHPSII